MKIARSMLACVLAASLFCLPIPAAAATGSPLPDPDASGNHADGIVENSDGPDDPLAPAPSSAPSTTNGPENIESTKDDASGAPIDSPEGNLNRHDGALAQAGEKAANAGDPNPPKLVSASVNKTEVGVGDTLTISYDISDADGIKSVSLIIKHPKNGITIRPTTGEHATKFTSTLIQSTTEAGTYEVIGYRVTDDKDFVSSIISKTYEGLSWSDPMYGQPIFENIPVLSYTVTITKDANSTQFITASVERTVCQAGGLVNVSFDIKDDDGIDAVALVLLSPSKSIVRRQGIVAPDGQSVSCTIAQNDKSGLYKIIGYCVNDKKGYVSSFIDTAYRTMTWPTTTYGTRTFMALPSVSFLVIDNSKVGSYHILEGADPIIEKGADENLTFRIDGELSDFVVATINGKDIPSSAYDLESGSTILTLKPSYIDSLPSGRNEFAAWYVDGGNATTTIEVLSNDEDPSESSNPQEEDESGATADAEHNDTAIGAGLLQSGDKAILCVVMGLLAMGALLAIVAVVSINRKKASAPR